MANENIARGRVSLTPVVTVAETADAPAKEVILDDIKGIVGGKVEYASVNNNDKWYYENKAISTNANIISNNFTDDIAIETTDLVRLLYVEYLEDQNDAFLPGEYPSLYITLDGGDAGQVSNTDSLVLDRGESLLIKLRTGYVNKINGAASSGSIQCKILAIIDDVSLEDSEGG